MSASNIQEDAIVSNDTFQDSSWDAVWQSSVSIDEGGGSVEIRIPLSQLRFLAADNQTWGINAVWTRQQEDTRQSGRLGVGRDARRLFSAQGDDVFLVKMAYWIGH